MIERDKMKNHNTLLVKNLSMTSYLFLSGMRETFYFQVILLQHLQFDVL